MLQMANMLPVARVVKSSGDKGRVIIRLAEDARVGINVEEPVFIVFDGLPVPFFIEESESKGSSQLTVKLEGIDNSDLSEEIKGAIIYVEKGDKGRKQRGRSKQTPDTGNREGDIDVIGYSVSDIKIDFRGVVSALYDYPGNPCIGITGEDGRERLLPLAADFIVSVNNRKREILIETPDGLLDL